MFATKALAIASFILAGVQALQVSTPDNVVQCGDTQITISDANGQYHVSVVPSVNPCDSDALFESDPLTGGSYTWKTKLPAGTQAMIVVDDTAGNEAWSGTFTVGAGDAACLGASSSSSSPSSTSQSTSSTSPSASSARTSLYINNHTASPSSTPSVNAPANAQQGNNQKGNTPATGAALSSAQASLFTVLAVMGVVTMAL